MGRDDRRSSERCLAARPYLSEISRGTANGQAKGDWKVVVSLAGRTVLISTVDGGVDVEDASKTISGEAGDSANGSVCQGVCQGVVSRGRNFVNGRVMPERLAR